MKQITTLVLGLLFKRIEGSKYFYAALRKLLSFDEKAIRDFLGTDLIHVKLVSTGKTGQEWLDQFEQQGISIDNEVKHILISPEFQPTSGVEYNTIIMQLGFLSEHGAIGQTTIQSIVDEASVREYKTPHIEVACLLREKYTNEQLKDLKIGNMVVHHKPINGLVLGIDSGFIKIDSRTDISGGYKRSPTEMNSIISTYASAAVFTE